ncbi:uncharacterized protein PFL1_00184 [Pseudozyma flocculosa PF-1]|uniref:uncharacterized protein n=1 Tax=Pseudozyma flocculosa PF-1 TaxID=1277687 RepID=UPI0004560F01|nr:uncharacterized protein PFL1_00184 [Pseudozyma flocculosa PF-1]EPQ31986.1 hypothetical protein PFL1_00184 [Pseudozyma flocculosa PF-1]
MSSRTPRFAWQPPPPCCTISTSAVHRARASKIVSTTKGEERPPSPQPPPATKAKKARAKAAASTVPEAKDGGKGKETKTRTKRAKKAAIQDDGPSDAPASPSATSPPPSTVQLRSSVARGTDFENLCIEVLARVFGMELERCGGAGDKGIDLKGWWRIPRPPVPNATTGSAGTEDSTSEGGARIRVVAQCKCQDVGGKKMGPVLVREVEGVLHRAHSSSRTASPSSSTPSEGSDDDSASTSPVVGIILSSSGFSKQALMQARSSAFPMMLLHVEQQAEPAGSSSGQQPPAMGAKSLLERCQAIVWNEGVAGPRGLLAGRMDLRWKRSLVAGRADRPVLFCDGQRMTF